ncbi:MAG: DUF4838 domain-containing protein [Candidatus Hydrogenedentes bacterium]|nr:DUF4838 domain-containing protein [Candidatus Hydrogenedentota bacterium]
MNLKPKLVIPMLLLFLMFSFTVIGQNIWIDATLYRELNIVLPKESESIVRDAVETFKKYWEKSTQKTITISPANEGKVNVWIGPEACTLEFMQDTSFAELGEEGFRILTYTPSKRYLEKGVARQLAICANSRLGTMHGVYSFFERVSGARWLSEDSVVIPIFKINIPHEDYTYTPLFEVRLFDTNLSRYKLAQELRQALHLRFDIPEEETGLICLGKLYRGGESLCLSNSGVFETLSKEMENLILSTPNRSIWIFRIPVEKKCECDRCKSYEVEMGSPTAIYLNLVNRVLEELDRKASMDKKRIALSLDAEFLAPIRNFDLHRNLWIELDTRSCDIAKPFSSSFSPDNKRFSDFLKGWLSLTNRLWVRYRAGVNPHNPIFPLVDLVYLQKNIQWLDQQGIKGIIFDIHSEKEWPFSDWDLLKRYLYARVIWEPDCMIDKEMEIFLRNYFGMAVGNILLGYFSLLNQYVGQNEFTLKMYEERIWWNSDFAEEYLRIIKSALSVAKDNETHYKRLLPFSLPAYYTSISLLAQEREKTDKLERLKKEVAQILDELVKISPNLSWEDYESIFALK